MDSSGFMTGFDRLDDSPEFSGNFLKNYMQIGKELTELELCKVWETCDQFWSHSASKGMQDSLGIQFYIPLVLIDAPWLQNWSQVSQTLQSSGSVSSLPICM